MIERLRRGIKSQPTADDLLPPTPRKISDRPTMTSAAMTQRRKTWPLVSPHESGKKNPRERAAAAERKRSP